MLTDDFKMNPDCDLRLVSERDLEDRPIEGIVRPHLDGEPSGGSGERRTLVCPSTGEPLAHIALAGREDVRDAVESSACSSALWRGATFPERARRLRRVAALIHEQRHSIAQTIAREQGKPYLEALSLEVLPALDHLRFIIHQAENYHAGLAVEPRHPFYTHKHAQYLYDPVGVVALVTASSMPFAAPLIQVAAALAMGNAAVLKPSERTPLSGLRVGELCTQAGFPPGLVNVVPAAPETTVDLVRHPLVDKVFVTGSFETGRRILAVAGCQVRPVVLSLGGNHPSIVAGDADPARAARGIAWGALANCGQNCGSVKRVYVVERIASLFLERLLDEVDRLSTGNSVDEGVDVGPLLSAERREEVHRRVTEAAQAGARIVRGGRIPDGPGFFYPPTVVLEPPADSPLLQREVLGPVIPVVVTDSVERAILLANDTDLKLTASGWTRSQETAERMMSGLRFGVVTVNDVLYSYGEPASTWSGYAKSGTGQSHGRPGLREMSRQRFVSFDPRDAEAPLFSFPYDEQGRKITEASLAYLNRRRRLGRLLAFFRLARLGRFRRRTPLGGLLAATRRRL